jgi:tetratricopeptide (TPR) repeat protein
MVDLKNERIQLRALETLFQQKKIPDALTMAERLSSEFPSSYHINILYVKILKEANRLRDAEEKAGKLMHLYPDNINLLLEMGTICLKLNKFDDAVEFFNKILFLDPFNTEARDSIEKIKVMEKNPPPAAEEKSVQRVDMNEDTVPDSEEAKFADLNINLNLEMGTPTGEEAEDDEEGALDEEGESPLVARSEFEPEPGPEPAAPKREPEPVQIPEIEETHDPSVELSSWEEEIPGAPEIPEVPEESDIPDFNGIPESEANSGSTFEMGNEVEEITKIPEIPDVPEISEIGEEVDSIESYQGPVEGYDEETVESLEGPLPPESEIDEEPGEVAADEEPDVEAVEETGEPVEEEETGFVTESAAELYLSQGLYDDALRVYEKLYTARQEERFLLKIRQLKAHRMGREKIRRLSDLLVHIREKGEKIV